MNQKLKKVINKFLITGTSSGLGKYLHGNLGGAGLNRQASEKERKDLKKNGAEVIIHCAFNSEQNPTDVDQYFCDNVFLTEELTSIPHKKFIFISSVDVYPKNSAKHKEEEILDANKTENLYAKTKLLSEDLVRRNCPNFLILRCSALLGKDSRGNSLIKIIKQNHPILTLSAKSLFNYVLHKDVLEFMSLAIEKDLQGVYNLASSESISLKGIASLLKKEVNYGNYIYDVGDIDNNKAITYLPAFKRTSKEIVIKFISTL